ncbi:alpha/beta-hydrolase [Ramicandelaber brevisporus]|nr:alpha/beta-hydrolase [Ramicandelaber brevisporus]
MFFTVDYSQRVIGNVSQLPSRVHRGRCLVGEHRCGQPEYPGYSGHYIYYEVHGTGPIKLFLLSGMLCPLSNYWFQILALTKNPLFQVVVHEYRGVGWSDSPSTLPTTTNKELALDALDLLNHLGWTDGIHLAGLSLGGMVAQELAMLDPKRFASVWLISATAGRWYATWPGLIKLGRSLACLWTPWFGKRFVEIALSRSWLQRVSNYDSLTNWEWATNYYLSIYQDTRLPTLRGLAGHLYAAYTFHVTDEQLQELRDASPNTRYVVVHGTDDIIIPHCCGEHLAKVLGAELILNEGSGHWTTVECADQISEAIMTRLLKWEGYSDTARYDSGIGASSDDPDDLDGDDPDNNNDPDDDINDMPLQTPVVEPAKLI